MNDNNNQALEQKKLLLPSTIDSLLPPSLVQLFRSLKSNQQSEQSHSQRPSMCFLASKIGDSPATTRQVSSVSQQQLFQSRPQLWKNQKERLEAVHHIYSQNNFEGGQNKLTKQQLQGSTPRQMNQQKYKSVKVGQKKDLKEGFLNSEALTDDNIKVEAQRYHENQKLKIRELCEFSKQIQLKQEEIQEQARTASTGARVQFKEQDKDGTSYSQFEIAPSSMSTELNADKKLELKKKNNLMESVQCSINIKNESIKQEGKQKGALYYPPVWLKRPKEFGNSKLSFAFLKNPQLGDFSHHSGKASCNISGLVPIAQTDKNSSLERLGEDQTLKNKDFGGIKMFISNNSQRLKCNTEKIASICNKNGTQIGINNKYIPTSEKDPTQTPKVLPQKPKMKENEDQKNEKFFAEQKEGRQGSRVSHRHFFSTHRLPSQSEESPSRKSKYKTLSQVSIQTSAIPIYRTEASEICIEDNNKLRFSQEIPKKQEQLKQVTHARANSQDKNIDELSKIQRKIVNEVVSKQFKRFQNDIQSENTTPQVRQQNLRESPDFQDKKVHFGEQNGNYQQQIVLDVRKQKEQDQQFHDFSFTQTETKTPINQEKAHLNELNSTEYHSIRQVKPHSQLEEIALAATRPSTSQGRKRRTRILNKNENEDSSSNQIMNSYQQTQVNSKGDAKHHQEDNYFTKNRQQKMMNQIDLNNSLIISTQEEFEIENKRGPKSTNLKKQEQEIEVFQTKITPKIQRKIQKFPPHIRENGSCKNSEGLYFIDEFQSNNSIGIIECPSTYSSKVFKNNFLENENQQKINQLKDTFNHQKQLFQDIPHKTPSKKIAPSKQEQLIPIEQIRQQDKNTTDILKFSTHFNSSLGEQDQIPITISRCGKRQLTEGEKPITSKKPRGTNLKCDFLSLFSQE